MSVHAPVFLIFDSITGSFSNHFSFSTVYFCTRFVNVKVFSRLFGKCEHPYPWNFNADFYTDPDAV